MSQTFYHPQTLRNLSNVLFGNSVHPRIAGVLVHTVQDAIIPWHKRHDIMSEAELLECVKDYVLTSFRTYDGSSHGYVSHENDRWYVYAALWGRRAANLLILPDFNDKSVGLNEESNLVIDGAMRTERNLYYTDRMIKWLRDNLPQFFNALNDEELISFTSEVYVCYGAPALALPVPRELDADGRRTVAEYAEACVDTDYGKGCYQKLKNYLESNTIAMGTLNHSDIQKIFKS